MNKYNDKYTSILTKKYDNKSTDINPKHYGFGFLSKKNYKDFNTLMSKKYNDKIWWMLLSKDQKTELIINSLYISKDIYNISEEQHLSIVIFREKYPLINEIRKYKLNKLLKSN